jgi:hypothetical protein
MDDEFAFYGVTGKRFPNRLSSSMTVRRQVLPAHPIGVRDDPASAPMR